ncbi:MAG TPA: MBG domain-containing protein, partial [Candidatus Dormibacteraeota bacterium]|nr:MBG domain-containing protein [Candidatus Dormibacteraeota bacterium]
VPANATYAAGQTLDFLVNVSEPVTVNTNGGLPRIALSVGTSSVFAVLAGGSGSTVLTFRYAVQLADQDADGVVLGTTLDLNGSLIQDASSNNIPTSLSNVPSTTGVLVNGMAPAAIADAYTMAEDSVLTGNVLTNDIAHNGNALTAILVSNPTNGVVTLSTNGAFVYTPATNVHGLDVFTYKANDGTIDSSPATVQITITNVNDPVQVGTPLVDQVTVYGNTNFSYNIPSSAFTDIDGDTLTYTVTGLPAGVGFTQTNLTIAGAPTAVGSNFVRVVASDGQFRATNTFTLTVGQATLVAVADDKTRVYGLTNPPLTITYIGFAGLDTAARLTNPPIASTTATNNSPVGTYPITLTNGADYRYSFVLSNGTLTIGKATVVATPIST